MQRPTRCADKPALERPRLEVAEILRTHGEAYQERYVLSPGQSRVLRNLQACRTELLGGHLDVCNRCGWEVPAYNSCRDRHCPKCQSVEQARWVRARLERVLPTAYFHVVFTVPSELQPLARRNQALFYGLLFRAASGTLLELGHDPARLGATLGITAVLHTWTRALHYHPHVHCIVTGGGLALDGSRWVHSPQKSRYLFPVRVLSRLFRGKFLALLADAVDRGEVTHPGHAVDDEGEREAFSLLKAQLYRKEWVVYAKRPFAGPQQVFRYLGLYTHRVGISNYRLLRHEDGQVTFATKNGNTATVAGVEFVRRFLQHVLPKRFVKIRHFGLHAAGNVNGKLARARELLPSPNSDTAPSAEPSQTFLDDLSEATPDLARCPRCGEGTLVRYRVDRRTGELVSVPEPET